MVDMNVVVKLEHVSKCFQNDNYVIMKNAKNEDNAYLFINYLLRQDVDVKITEEYSYISPNKIKQASDIAITTVFTNGFYVKNSGSEIKKYDKLWAGIK